MDYVKTNAESSNMTWTNAMGVYHGNNTPYSSFSLCEVKYDLRKCWYLIFTWQFC